MKECTPFDSLKSKFESVFLQATRLLTTFAFFHLQPRGFKIYIATAPNYNFARFHKLVGSVTKDFKRISKGIINLEKELRFEGYNNAANLIDRLQGEEEVRLRLCAQLQIAKQDALDNPDLPEKWNDVALLKEK